MLKIKTLIKSMKYNVLIQRCAHDNIKKDMLFEPLRTLGGASRPLSACCIPHNPYLDFFNNIGGNYKVEKNEYELLVEMYTEAEKREYFYKSVGNTKSLLHSYIQGSDAYNFLLNKQEVKIRNFKKQLKIMEQQIQL
ncbi:Hypothetical_protein [Hexamita inflata]|uniref:Hypothetical_protein n=1 Tax=Hexamita inflata TaxID=28002 RepID=A0AA86P5A8_9EUKA|nr:Hypothetical protein HINF_LOCUS19340 [Hexamita inflata]CAI9931699.1 Hypothetical protein HINF_LOCUS19344 [Hexamita inflata]